MSQNVYPTLTATLYFFYIQSHHLHIIKFSASLKKTPQNRQEKTTKKSMQNVKSNVPLLKGINTGLLNVKVNRNNEFK